MGCILHDLHLQAGDDEEESGPNVSHVTGPEESAARHPPARTGSWARRCGPETGAILARATFARAILARAILARAIPARAILARAILALSLIHI